MKPILFTIFLLSCATSGFAAVNLSVMPLDGGSTLRLQQDLTGFGNKREVRLRVVSTGHSRYQIFQRMVGPLINEKGENLNTQAIETQALPNSNAAGTLYLQSPQRLAMGEELIYTSGPNGESDGFVIGYSLRPELLNAGGRFAGRIMFSVRAAGEPEAQSVVDMTVEAKNTLKISIQGSRNPTEVRISDADTMQTADSVKVTFSGNSGQEIRIYQQFEELPRNESGQTLESDALQMQTIGGQAAVKTPSLVDQSRDLIYTGLANEDSFQIYFLLDPHQLPHVEPGNYKGQIKYTAEYGNGSRQDFEIALQCRIQPIFTMDITPPAEGLKFSHVLAANPPQIKEFTITVRSNLHRPYQVSQGLQAPMTNEQGREFNSQYFTFKVEVPSDQKGKSKFTDFIPVKTGDYPVFSSDSKGSQATFKVIYQMQGYPEMNSGDFVAPIRFSLDQN